MGTPDELEGLDNLALTGAFLDKLAGEIPTPTPDLDRDALYFAPLGARAVTLYANFRHAMSSPVDLGPILAVRPLIELAILVKWVSLNPTFHGELWFAESDANELTHYSKASAHIVASDRHFEPPTSTEPTEEKTRRRDEARAALAAAGRNYGNKLIPTVARMVEEVERAIPDHKNPVRDAYDLVYRGFSPWEHSDATSFKSTAVGDETGSWHWVGDQTWMHREDLLAIATSIYSYAIETVLTGTKTGDPRLARMARDFVTMHWVRSDRLRPDEP
jgi:hypothetical protein